MFSDLLINSISRLAGFSRALVAVNYAVTIFHYEKFLLRTVFLFLAALACLPVSRLQAQATVSTLAGTGTAGFADGSSAVARFNNPSALTADAAGNVYVADFSNHRIRKISVGGTVTTLAGSGTAGFADGVGVGAQFNFPSGVAVDATGVVYVADAGNNRIRRVAADGSVTTLAGAAAAGYVDATGTVARFSYPGGLALQGSTALLIADTFNNRIRSLVLASGLVTTVAGSGAAGSNNGAALTAEFRSPTGLAIAASGQIYVADRFNHSVRLIALDGTVSTWAGSGVSGFADGAGFSAQFANPYAVAVTTSGLVYVADEDNSRIRQIASDGTVSTLAGNGTPGFINGPAAQAQFRFATGVALSGSGTLYVADAGNHAVRAITLAAAPAFTSLLPTTLTIGLAANFTLTASGSPTPSFALANGNLPPGVTLSANGLLTGAPTAAGSYTGTFTATNVYGTASQAFSITVAATPANDNFALAQTLTGNAGNVTGNNTGASGETSEPVHVYASGTASSVWYRWTPTVGGLASIDTSGSSIDTLLAVYTGFSLTTLAKVGENDDASPGVPTSKVTFTATVGTPYYIAVGSFGTGNAIPRGALQLHYGFLTPIISVLGTSTGALGQNYSYTINASGSPTSFVVNGLPGGLTYNPATGVISGTPAQAGIFNVTLSAANTFGSGTAPLTLTITGQGYLLWLSNNFTPAEQVNALLSAPTADPEGDGRVNLIEYALGSEPRLRELTAPTTLTLEGGQWVFRYTRPVNGAPGITYTVETSEDLTHWIVAPSMLESTLVTVAVFKTSLSASAPRVYVRLRVTNS